MLQKHFTTMASKSLNEILKLVIMISRKIELKRESKAFQTNYKNQKQFCPICKSAFEGKPSQWYLDGSARCQNQAKSHEFNFDYSTKSIKTSFNLTD